MGEGTQATAAAETEEIRVIGQKNNPYRSKARLRTILHDAVAETQRLQALDVTPTIEEARQQLSAEMRKRRKAELELNCERSARALQELPPEPAPMPDVKTLIEQAKKFLEHNGFVVIPHSAISNVINKHTNGQSVLDKRK